MTFSMYPYVVGRVVNWPWNVGLNKSVSNATSEAKKHLDTAGSEISQPRGGLEIWQKITCRTALTRK